MYKYDLFTGRQECYSFGMISVLLRFETFVSVSSWLVKDDTIYWRPSLCFCDDLCWCIWLEAGFISEFVF